MKKLRSLTLIFLLSLLVLAGCAGDQTATNEEQAETKTDVVTAATMVKDEEVFKKSISEDGVWIICTLNDLSFEEELVVEGTFRNKDNPENDIYRKIAPYTQDDNHKVNERFTITAPKMVIKSPNTRFQAGIFVGDIYVQANGFSLRDAKVEGNLYFANEEYQSSSEVSDDSTVTGVIEVK